MAILIRGEPYIPGIALGSLCRSAEALSETTESIVLLTHPEDLSQFISLPAGIIVVEAAPFSHAMINLLGLGLPTVLISAREAKELHGGVQLLLDGSKGLITDDLNTLGSAEKMPHRGTAGQAALMSDGDVVNLWASVRQVGTVGQAKRLGATSIGLVRSEFLIPHNGQVPGQAFYLQAFGDICRAAEPLTVTFRLLDVAADKIPPWLFRLHGIDESLDVQGVRLYKMEPVQAVIQSQLAALSELCNTFSIRVLLPYLVRVEEFDYWMHWVRQGLPIDMPVGAMAETPAMVLDMGHLLQHADFVAIGCNDLMQGLFAADRDVPQLRHYLDPYAPVLYRLLQQVADQAGDQINRIQLCGVLPQIQGVLPVLLGLGYRNFSVDAPFISHLAHQISGLSQADCEGLASKVCEAGTTRQVLSELQLNTDRHVPFVR